MRYLLFLVFFGLSGVTFASVRNKAFVPRNASPAVLTKQLSVRGGAISSPITPDLAAKICTAIYVGQGSAFTLVPEAFKPYGLEQLDASQQTAGEYFGAWITAIGVAAYCLFVANTSANSAIGYGLTVLLLNLWRSYWADKPSRAGYANALVPYSSNLGHAISAYALLANREWATKFVTYWCYFGLLNGIIGILNPTKLATLWGQDEELAKDTLTGLFTRSAAFSISAYAVLTLALFNDVDRYKAFAYATAIFCAHLISANWIVKETSKLGMNKALFNFWIVFLTVMIGSLVA